MERRELLKIAASLGAVGIGGRFITACTSTTTTTPPASTTPGGASGAGTPGSTATPGTAAPSTTLLAQSGYGPLGAADANSLRLPSGFTSRIIATSGQPVANTGYTWHDNPDGGACFAASDGGWVYVSNSESGPAVGGGVSMVRFAKDGSIVEARRILADTTLNCSGGATPWGSWLSCEEFDEGRVHECFPLETKPAQVHPAMGVFSHEAVAVDEANKTLYLTEDQFDSGFYRFRPTAYPDLSAGTLEVLTEEAGKLGWAAVPDPSAASGTVRTQVPTKKSFINGEGVCLSGGAIYFTTKGDDRVWKYDPKAVELTVVYDAAKSAAPILRGVDNITASANGELFVCEDGDDMQLVQLFGTTVEPVVQVEGAVGSEITGPAFSPDGTRLYFSSQRTPGVTYEVTGPWHN